MSIPVAQHWLRRLAIVLAGAITVMIGARILEDPRELLQTDWTAFDNAADRLFAGETIYRPWNAESEPLPYLYPPYALLLAAPLALLGFFGSWAISAALSAVTAVVGFRFAMKASELDDSSDRLKVARGTAMTLAVTTGTVISSVVIGQYSGIYVLAFGLGLWLYVEDRRFAAGLALALLMLKPNIAIAIPVVLVWSRSWPVLKGFGLGAALALVSSVPFGLGLWGDFFDNVSNMSRLQAEGRGTASKSVNFAGMFEQLSGARFDSPITIAAWLVFTSVVGVGTLWVWRPEVFRQSPHRAFGVLAMFVVIANPRMFFYDGALVVFGFLCLWTLPERLLSEQTRNRLGFLAFIGWVSSWGAVFNALNVFVAPVGALAIAFVVLDIHQRRDVLGGDGSPPAALLTAHDDSIDLHRSHDEAA